MDYYQLSLQGKLTDFVLIEATEEKEIEYKVHSLVLYAESNFLRYLIDNGQNKAKIQSPREGLLETIIEAIYKKNIIGHIYQKYVANHPFTEVLQLFEMCNYLQLTSHLKSLSHHIEVDIDTDDILEAYITYQKKNMLFPDELTEILKKELVNDYMYQTDDYGDTLSYVDIRLLKHPDYPLIQPLLPY